MKKIYHWIIDILIVSILFCLFSCGSLISRQSGTTTTTVEDDDDFELWEPDVHYYYDTERNTHVIEAFCETEGAKIFYRIGDSTTGREYTAPVSVYASEGTVPTMYHFYSEKDGIKSADTNVKTICLYFPYKFQAARYRYDDEHYLVEAWCEKQFSSDESIEYNEVFYTISDVSNDIPTIRSLSFSETEDHYQCTDGVNRCGVLVPDGKYVSLRAYKTDYSLSGTVTMRIPWKGKPQGHVTLTYKGVREGHKDFVYMAEYDGTEEDVSLYQIISDDKIDPLALTNLYFSEDGKSGPFESAVGAIGEFGATVRILVTGDGYDDWEVSDAATLTDTHESLIKLPNPTVKNFKKNEIVSGRWQRVYDKCVGYLCNTELTDDEDNVIAYLQYRNSDVNGQADEEAEITTKHFDMELRYAAADPDSRYVSSDWVEFEFIPDSYMGSDTCGGEWYKK
ncbi:MAG: hypothetical protein IKQ61_08285 [Spirochaetales bacterium]|nr:hypothetical protein [Spirochaetales bacterium]